MKPARRLDRVRLLQLREELRTEQAAVADALRAVETALAGVEKLLATPQPRPLSKRDADIVAAVRSGEDQKDVATRYGITQQRVSQIVKAVTSVLKQDT